MINHDELHDRIHEALAWIPDGITSEALFGLSDEEFEYAAERVQERGSDPVQLAMTLGAGLALKKAGMATLFGRAASEFSQ